MHFFNWLFGGIVGGAIGAAIWVAIEYSTQSEYGWIAWPVGLLVGLGVHKAASADIRGGFLRGAVAALLALAAVIGAGKAKAVVMTKMAEKAAEPANISAKASHDAHDASEETETANGEAPEVQDLLNVLESPSTSIIESSMPNKQGNAFKEKDMLWLCLSAVTAYMVGKGSGPSKLQTEEEAAAEAEKKAEQQTEQQATDEQKS